MEIEPLGENALILRSLDEPAALVARKLREALPHLVDVVPCYGTVGLYFQDSCPKLPDLLAALEKEIPEETSREHLVPVCYEMGLDFETASHQLGISGDELIERHSERIYECSAIGFTPGFAYLGTLDPRISSLPRLSSPRPKVPKGSVGITGSQTAVYPSCSPGGWNLIGRTPLEMVNLEDEYFPISVGDRIRFYPINKIEFQSQVGRKL